MSNNKSILTLKNMVFEKISFERKGFRNKNTLDNTLSVKFMELKDNNETEKISEDEELFKVSLKLEGNKEEEYVYSIILSGYFSLDSSVNIDKDMKNKIVRENTVAILMPYLRSEVSLLTSQPETDCVVMPVINVASALSKK